MPDPGVVALSLAKLCSALSELIPNEHFRKLLDTEGWYGEAGLFGYVNLAGVLMCMQIGLGEAMC